MQYYFKRARDFSIDSFFKFQGIAEITSALQYATFNVGQSCLLELPNLNKQHKAARELASYHIAQFKVVRYSFF